MRDKRANPDRRVAEIGSRQHGVVSLAQLLAAGLTRQGVVRRVQAGRLYRLHRAVYALGHPQVSFEGRCMAAALACGPDAVVSHASAAVIWDMLRPASGLIHITVPTDSGRRRRVGIAGHRSAALGANDVTRRHGIPVTRPARTLRDLRRSSSPAAVRRATRRAVDLRLVAADDVDEVGLTRSELERRFLGLCRRHRLPHPEVNARIEGFEVDFLWRSESLIVETDGFRFHGTRAAFEADRARDARLQTRGYRVLRFSYRQVTDERSAVAEAIRQALGGESQMPLSRGQAPAYDGSGA